MQQPAYHIGAQARVRSTYGGLLYGNEVGTITQVVETATHCYYTLIFAHRPSAVFRETELEPAPRNDP
jgi:hypothetical protein